MGGRKRDSNRNRIPIHWFAFFKCLQCLGLGQVKAGTQICKPSPAASQGLHWQEVEIMGKNWVLSQAFQILLLPQVH